MDKEAWHAAVHEVTKSWTWLSDWTENSITKENLQYVINGFNTLCKWIPLGKLREEAERQLTSGLYKKCLGRKTGRIPPNCPWWLFLDGRTPGGFSSYSYVFIYSFMYFLNFLQTAWGQLFFSGCFGVQWEKKKEKQGRSDEHERKVKLETLLCERQTYRIRARPTEELYLSCSSFIFWFTVLIHIYQDSKETKMKKIPFLPSSSQFLLTDSSP